MHFLFYIFIIFGVIFRSKIFYKNQRLKYHGRLHRNLIWPIPILTRQFNSGFFYPSGLPFLSGKYLFQEINICVVIFQCEFNELGFEALQRLVIALISKLRLSGARLILSSESHLITSWKSNKLTFILTQMFLHRFRNLFSSSHVPNFQWI